MIADCDSKREILERLGLPATGGNYAALRRALAAFSVGEKLSIGVAERRAATLKEVGIKARIPDDEFFSISDVARQNSTTRKRLLEKGWPEKCAGCGIGNTWQGRPLVLQIDHINGVRTDHRLENLRFMCPNCHSQTDTFAGRNCYSKSTGETRSRPCLHCGSFFPRSRKQCPSCKGWPDGNPYLNPRPAREKIAWPSDEELVAAVMTRSVRAVAMSLGVSDVAVRKRLIARGLGQKAGLNRRTAA